MTPRLSYVICTTARSGSNLLFTALAQTGIAGRPQEYFVAGLRDEFFYHDQLKVRDYRDYVRAVIAASTTANGIFGVSLHAVQGRLFMARARYSEGKEFTSLRQAIETVFPNTRYIFLTRKDKVAQAVSNYRAVMTGEWRRFGDRVPDSDRMLSFNHYGIKRGLEHLTKSDEYWEEFFRMHALSPLRLTYEELTDNYEGVLQRVFVYLGLPEDTPVPSPVTKKISDQRSSVWAEEFLRREKSDPIKVIPDSTPWAPF